MLFDPVVTQQLMSTTVKSARTQPEEPADSNLQVGQAVSVLHISCTPHTHTHAHQVFNNRTLFHPPVQMYQL